MSQPPANQANEKKRIGLYGGSFNPPHYGHFIAAFYAYHFLDLDEVWMMVTPGSPLKDPSSYAPLADRKALCDMVAAGHDWLKPTDIEKDFYTGQTIDSLYEIKARHPEDEFIWIMGADNLAAFHKWHRWQEIIDNFPIAVLARPGDGAAALQGPAAQYAAALKIDDAMDMKGRAKGWCFIDTPGFSISSSAIVRELRTGKSGLRDLLPAVETEIRARGLYGTATGAAVPDGAPSVKPPAPPAP